MLAPHIQSSCKSGEIKISYRIFGADVASKNALPVVFIHGLSYFSFDWVNFGFQLCGSVRSGCAMDMRGFGDSTNSLERDYTVPSMAEDIKNLLGKR